MDFNWEYNIYGYFSLHGVRVQAFWFEFGIVDSMVLRLEPTGLTPSDRR